MTDGRQHGGATEIRQYGPGTVATLQTEFVGRARSLRDASNQPDLEPGNARPELQGDRLPGNVGAARSSIPVHPAGPLFRMLAQQVRNPEPEPPDPKDNL